MTGLIDCDNFFCSCERVFRPDLAHTPIVVLSNNDGCVVARSAEVKAMGIPECLPYFKLRELYPHAGIVAFSSNYSLYADMSARVMAILREEVPEVMQYSIDEAFLDLDGMAPDKLKSWGEHLTAKVRKHTGIPVSLGIAPNKTLAKIASKFAKRCPAYNKSCAILTTEQRLKALSLFKVSDVWGIGPRTTDRLSAMGIHTALQYAGLSPQLVRRLFHLPGFQTWLELNGRDAITTDSMDGTPRKTIVTSRSMPDMISDRAQLSAHVANYAARCAAKLRRQRSVCSMLTVFIESNRFRADLRQSSTSGAYTFATPTASTTEIVEAALKILPGIFCQGILYKRAGVMVAGISSDRAIQPDLFTYSPERSGKLRQVSMAIDDVNRRWGADTVGLASQQYSRLRPDGRRATFVDAIRRDLMSPPYSTTMSAFEICPH